MSTDGGLRKLFQDHLPEAQWQSVETWSTGQGVPDMEYCFKGGLSGWIENKKTEANAVGMRSEQIGWIERRVRMGGRAFVAVRRRFAGGARRVACDELWLFHGRDARALYLGGLTAAKPLLCCVNGPARWDWEAVKKVITA